MIKLRYNAETGRVGKAYRAELEVPQPYIEITEEENNSISADDKHIYFVVDGELIAKSRANIEKKERIARMYMTPLDFIKCLETFNITYTQIKSLCDANEEVDKNLRLCANVFRGNPLLDNLCGQFGVTPQQLDELFEKYGKVYEPQN